MSSIKRGTPWNERSNNPAGPARARVRWDACLVERLKEPIVDIPKHQGGKPETIRVSVLPKGHHLYADVRVYVRGHPTGQGLVVHHDLIPDVIAGLQEALRRGWKP